MASVHINNISMIKNLARRFSRSFPGASFGSNPVDAVRDEQISRFDRNFVSYVMAMR